MHVQKLTVLKDFLSIHEIVCLRKLFCFVLICRNNVLDLDYELISMKEVKIEPVELIGVVAVDLKDILSLVLKQSFRALQLNVTSNIVPESTEALLFY